MYRTDVPFRAEKDTPNMFQNFVGIINALVTLEFNKFCPPRPDLNQEESVTKKFPTDPEHSAVDQCCGSGMFIPDPNFFHPGSEFFPSGSAKKSLGILTQNNGF